MKRGLWFWDQADSGLWFWSEDYQSMLVTWLGARLRFDLTRTEDVHRYHRSCLGLPI